MKNKNKKSNPSHPRGEALEVIPFCHLHLKKAKIVVIQRRPVVQM
jgi:hypothetical protein